jgi:hypothetical protein
VTGSRGLIRGVNVDESRAVPMAPEATAKLDGAALFAVHCVA